jgi:predicted peptidase
LFRCEARSAQPLLCCADADLKLLLILAFGFALPQESSSIMKIRISSISLCILCWSASTLFSQEAMPKNQSAETFQRQLTKKVAANYLLFLPEGYDAQGAKRWPLILFLHGAGERGTNISKVAVHGPPKIVKDKADFPFIVVSPQCPSSETWSNDTLVALLDDVIRKHAVDTNRIYLTGISMGGYGTWSLGLAHPERFAAIAPICGGGDPLGTILPSPSQARLLKKLPVWAFHGAKDTLVKLEESERMINALKKIGNEANLTVYPEAGHDSWTETYNKPELYEWFLQHRRDAPSEKKTSSKKSQGRPAFRRT